MRRVFPVLVLLFLWNGFHAMTASAQALVDARGSWLGYYESRVTPGNSGPVWIDVTRQAGRNFWGTMTWDGKVKGSFQGMVAPNGQFTLFSADPIYMFGQTIAAPDGSIRVEAGYYDFGSVPATGPSVDNGMLVMLHSFSWGSTSGPMISGFGRGTASFGDGSVDRSNILVSLNNESDSALIGLLNVANITFGGGGGAGDALFQLTGSEDNELLPAVMPNPLTPSANLPDAALMGYPVHLVGILAHPGGAATSPGPHGSPSFVLCDGSVVPAPDSRGAFNFIGTYSWVSFDGDGRGRNVLAQGTLNFSPFSAMLLPAVQ